jgi:hypothetical protein
MNTLPSEAMILKTDTRGRVRATVARREQLLDEFAQSGLTAVKFAELTGIKYQTFATWVQKRRRKQGGYPAGNVPALRDQVRWLEAMVEPAQSSGGSGQPHLVLHLPGGARLELSDVKQVEITVALLRALPPPC